VDDGSTNGTGDIMELLGKKNPETVRCLYHQTNRGHEIPISYTGRTYRGGRKITWVDNFKAIGALPIWGLVAWYRKDRLVR